MWCDFGTPVQLISSSQKGDKVRLKVDLKGEWEHSAYQSDDQFVLEVREKKIDPTKLTPGPRFLRRAPVAEFPEH